MSSRPSGWPRRSTRSATAAGTTCGRRTVEVSQAGRHVAGAATAKPLIPATCEREEIFHPLLLRVMEMACLHDAVKVAALHTFTGRNARDRRGDAISRPASGNHDGKLT